MSGYTPPFDMMQHRYALGSGDLTPVGMARSREEFRRGIAALEAELSALRSASATTIGFDAGVTFAVTGENAGHWVEGAPTHVPVQELRDMETDRDQWKARCEAAWLRSDAEILPTLQLIKERKTLTTVISQIRAASLLNLGERGMYRQALLRVRKIIIAHDEKVAEEKRQ